MKKIIVIGCPGSGKSTFSRKLSQKVNLPLIHLDMLFWNPDRTTVDKEIFISRLEKALSGEKWIIDGNYSSTIEIRIKACDTVFFLDYPADICLEGVLKRRGKPRSDMPWVESADEIDDEFLQSIKDYEFKNRPKIISLLQNYKDKNIVIFKNRIESDDYLANI